MINPIFHELMREFNIACDEPYTPPKFAHNEPPLVCCDEVQIAGGHYVCHGCGLVKNHYVMVQPSLYPRDENGQTINNGYTITRHRYYKIKTHFTTHLKLYLNSGVFKRNGIYPPLPHTGVNMQDPYAYSAVRAYLKSTGRNDLYKYVWRIIYHEGGNVPTLTTRQQEELYRNFDSMENFFNYGWVRKSRHNIPSVPMLLSLLLHRCGHKPYYKFPALKNGSLREHVQNFYNDYIKYVTDIALVAGGSAPS